jgi:hypothetical protein
MDSIPIADSTKYAFDYCLQEIDQGYCSKEKISTFLCLLDSLKQNNPQEYSLFLSVYSQSLLEIIKKIDVHKLHLKEIEDIYSRAVD